MTHFFISYAREDGDFAEILKSRLAAAGLENWLDEERLRAGEDWQDAIDGAIRDAAAMVVVMSANARTSEYVAYEWAFALGAGVTVVPLLAGPAALHPRLESLHYLDFTDRTTRPWEALFERLQQAGASLAPRGVRVARDAPAMVHDAVSRLDSAQREERETGVTTLSQIDHPAGREALRAALHHPMVDVRLEAARALGHARDAESAPALREALHDARTRVVAAACVALAAIGDHAAVPALRELCRRSQDPASNGALYALGLLGDAETVPDIVQCLRSDDVYVRELATFALGRIGGAGVIAPLLEALADEDANVRGESARALAELGAPALSGLTSRLAEGGPDERVAAAFALSRMREPEAARALGRCSEDTTESRIGSRSFAAHAASEFIQRGGGSALYRIDRLAADALARSSPAQPDPE